MDKRNPISKSEDMTENKSPHIQIIGSYLLFKGYGLEKAPIIIESNEQLQFIIRRNLRSASNLAKAYSVEEVEKIMEILDQNAPFDWNISSVEKYIGRDHNEIIKNLKVLKQRK